MQTHCPKTLYIYLSIQNEIIALKYKPARRPASSARRPVDSARRPREWVQAGDPSIQPGDPLVSPETRYSARRPVIQPGDPVSEFRPETRQFSRRPVSQPGDPVSEFSPETRDFSPEARSSARRPSEWVQPGDPSIQPGDPVSEFSPEAAIHTVPTHCLCYYARNTFANALSLASTCWQWCGLHFALHVAVREARLANWKMYVFAFCENNMATWQQDTLKHGTDECRHIVLRHCTPISPFKNLKWDNSTKVQTSPETREFSPETRQFSPETRCSARRLSSTLFSVAHVIPLLAHCNWYQRVGSDASYILSYTL